MHLLLGFFYPGDIVKGYCRGISRKQPGPAAAETHRLPVSSLRPAKQEEQQTADEYQRKKAKQQPAPLKPGRFYLVIHPLQVQPQLLEVDIIQVADDCPQCGTIDSSNQQHILVNHHLQNLISLRHSDCFVQADFNRLPGRKHKLRDKNHSNEDNGDID